MKQSLIIAMFVLLLITIGIVAWFVSRKPQELSMTIDNDNGATSAIAQKPEIFFDQPPDIQEIGVIEGSLSFPSEYIPEDMIVCANSLEENKIYCTSNHIIGTDTTYRYGVGYRLEVPVGKYLVYAYLPQRPEEKAYYSEFVECGFDSYIGCTSHEPIVVNVEEGQIVDSIDPGDWYAPQSFNQD